MKKHCPEIAFHHLIICLAILAILVGPDPEDNLSMLTIISLLLLHSLEFPLSLW